MFKRLFLCLAVFSLLFVFQSDSFAQKKKKKTTTKKTRPDSVQIISTVSAPTVPEKTEIVLNNLTPQQKRRFESFDKVWNTINENYFDPTFNGLDWKAIRTEFQPKVGKLKTDLELHMLLQEMISRLDRSHFYIIPPETYQEIEAAKAESQRKELARKKAAKVEKENEPEKETDDSKEDEQAEIFYQYGVPIDIRIINSQAVITEIKKDSNAEKAGLRQGFVIDKINGVSVKTLIYRLENHQSYARLFKKEMPKILLTFLLGAEDSEVEITYLDENNQSHTLQIKREGLEGELVRILKNLPEQLLTFESKSLDEKTGYIRFNFFAFPVLNKFCAALTEFKNKEALIIDLRGNSGGAFSVLYGLTGLITNRTISVGTEIKRVGKQSHFVNPLPKNYKGKVVVLVDDQSVSAAEIFASGLKENGRATVIGDKTAGEALPAMTIPLPTGAFFTFPISNFQSPKGNIVEGNGVEPDLQISLDRNSLLAGKDIQLEKALSFLKESPQAKVFVDTDEEPPPPKAASTPKPTPGPIIMATPSVVLAPKPPEFKQDEKAIEVFNNFIKAVGGENALRSISSFTAHGEVEINQGGAVISGDLDIYRKAPNKIAEVMNFEGAGEIREIFDGQNYFVQSLFQGVIQQNSILGEYNLYADFYEALKFKELFPNLKYSGIFDRSGRKTHLIEATTEKGVKVAFAFDAETNFLVSRAGYFLTVSYEDYKKFNNLMIPTTLNKSNFFKFKLSDVKFDTNIPDSKFIKEENCFTKID